MRKKDYTIPYTETQVVNLLEIVCGTTPQKPGKPEIFEAPKRYSMYV